MRWSLPPLPFADADSWGYIGPAVCARLDGPFIQIYGRGFLYPLLLRWLLGLAGSFRGLVYAQHLLGLGAGLVWWSAWRRSVRLIAPALRWRWLASAFGLAGLACFVLNNKLIIHEHSLRPEAVFSAGAAVVIWLVVRAFTLEPASARFARNGAALGALQAVLYFLHPSFALATAAAAPVWWRGWRGGQPLGRLACLVLALPAAGAALWAADRAVYARRDAGDLIFGPAQFFSYNALAADQALRDDLAAAGPLPYDRQALAACARLLEADFARTRTEGRTHATLPFRPNVIMYAPDSACAFIFAYFHYDMPAARAFFLRYDLRAVLHHPLTCAAKVARSLSLAYRGALVTQACAARIPVREELAATGAELFGPYPQMRRFPEGVAYARRLAAAAPAPARNAFWAQGLLYVLAPAYAAAAAGVLGVAAAAALSRAPRWRRLGPPAALALTLLGFNFLITLTVAIWSTVDTERYSENQLAFTVFALFNAGMVCAAALWPPAADPAASA
jgi:hypothetical protein